MERLLITETLANTAVHRLSHSMQPAPHAIGMHRQTQVKVAVDLHVAKHVGTHMP